MVDVTIGTPPQPFRLLVSHDSSVTYVLGATCVSGVCPDHAKYDYKKSMTANGYPKDAKIKVGTFSNEALAFPANDNIQIGDITIRQATFAVAVSDNLTVLRELADVHYDGVLGLGTFKADNDYTKPVLSTAVAQKALDKSLYTIWLQRQNGGDCEAARTLLPVGSLTLGDLNTDKCASSIDWHPLRARYADGNVFDYSTKVDRIEYGGQAYPLDTSITWTARFDPSFSLVFFAPSNIADDIAKRAGAEVIIDSSNERDYPISCAAKPDEVKLVMDGQTYVIPGRYLIDRYYNASNSCSLQIIANDDYVTLTTKSYQFLVGSPFLREYCQTYDADNNRIGFSENTDASAMDTSKLCAGPPLPTAPTTTTTMTTTTMTATTTTPKAGSILRSAWALFAAITLHLSLVFSQ